MHPRGANQTSRYPIPESIKKSLLMQHSRRHRQFHDAIGHVFELKLEGLSLSGGLNVLNTKASPALAALNLQGNNLHVAIPASISLLRSLKSLNLSSNYFNNTIPSQLGDMLGLQSSSPSASAPALHTPFSQATRPVKQPAHRKPPGLLVQAQGSAIHQLVKKLAHPEPPQVLVQTPGSTIHQPVKKLAHCDPLGLLVESASSTFHEPGQ